MLKLIGRLFCTRSYRKSVGGVWYLVDYANGWGGDGSWTQNPHGGLGILEIEDYEQTKGALQMTDGQIKACQHKVYTGESLYGLYVRSWDSIGIDVATWEGIGGAAREAWSALADSVNRGV